MRYRTALLCTSADRHLLAHLAHQSLQREKWLRSRMAASSTVPGTMELIGRNLVVPADPPSVDKLVSSQVVPAE